jgi:hypothetical protein
LAYTLNDPYGTLRAVMRLNGLLVGLSLGFLFLLAPSSLLPHLGLDSGGPLWPTRLSGVLLMGTGIFLLLSAQERLISIASMTAMLIANAGIAIVLLLAYLQREMVEMSIWGQLTLVVLFVLCLVGALTPLRYLTTEYQRA